MQESRLIHIMNCHWFITWLAIWLPDKVEGSLVKYKAKCAKVNFTEHVRLDLMGIYDSKNITLMVGSNPWPSPGCCIFSTTTHLNQDDVMPRKCSGWALLDCKTIIWLCIMHFLLNKPALGLRSLKRCMYLLSSYGSLPML